jgi:DNA polymerase I-like protein with 3'-5' exonuclease and polymerase domains
VDKEKVKEYFDTVEFRSLENRLLAVVGGEVRGDEIKEEKKIEEVDYTEAEKAKIAFWLLNSEHNDPTLEEVSSYRGSKSFSEALEKLESDIEKEKLDYVYREIEIPLIPIIKKMEEVGIAINTEYFKKLSKEYHKELDLIEKDIWQKSGKEFTFNFISWLLG